MITYANVKKLGNVASLSRPVGKTCPSSCPLLDAGCYAQRYHFRSPIVQRAHERNYRPSSWPKWIKSNVDSLLENRPVALRINVAGDIMDGNRLDIPFLRSLIGMLQGYQAQAGSILPSWTYTHGWRILSCYPRERILLERHGCQIFASVHSEEEARQAESIGYRIAIISDLTKTMLKQTDTRYHPDRKAIVCPEQIGTKQDCLSCGYCFSPDKGNVIFGRH